MDLYMRSSVCAHRRSIHINYFWIPVSNTKVEKNIKKYYSVIQFRFSQAEVIIWITYRKFCIEANSFLKWSTVVTNEFFPSSGEK